MALKGGRPRLDSRQGFKEAFARILPALLERTISKGEASRRLGISPRSLRRYLAADKEAQKVAQAEAVKRLFRLQLRSSTDPEEDFPHR